MPKANERPLQWLRPCGFLNAGVAKLSMDRESSQCCRSQSGGRFFGNLPDNILADPLRIGRLSVADWAVTLRRLVRAGCFRSQGNV
jgi:hypothetical protein